jgi:hypothetical protein
MASQQGLSASGQLEDGRNARGGFENRHARQVVRGEGAQGAESLIAMLELDDGMWLQDRNNMVRTGSNLLICFTHCPNRKARDCFFIESKVFGCQSAVGCRSG